MQEQNLGIILICPTNQIDYFLTTLFAYLIKSSDELAQQIEIKLRDKQSVFYKELEAGIFLLKSYYFKGKHVATDDEERKLIYNLGKKLSERLLITYFYHNIIVKIP